MSREIFDCLKRERDICVKTVIPSLNTAFRSTPILTSCKIVIFPLIVDRLKDNRAEFVVSSLISKPIRCQSKNMRAFNQGQRKHIQAT